VRARLDFTDLRALRAQVLDQLLKALDAQTDRCPSLSMPRASLDRERISAHVESRPVIAIAELQRQPEDLCIEPNRAIEIGCAIEHISDALNAGHAHIVMRRRAVAQHRWRPIPTLVAMRAQLFQRSSDVTRRSTRYHIFNTPAEACSEVTLRQRSTKPDIGSDESAAGHLRLLEESPEAAETVDKAKFFAIMGAFPTGVTVVTALDENGDPRGLTSNAVSSVSAEPPLMLVCVDKRSNTLPALRYSRKFVVNFLTAGRGDLSNLFASKTPNKFAEVAWRPAGNGMPWLHGDSLAHAECSTEHEIDAGDHLVFVARVTGGQPPAPGTQPLMYFRRTYGTWQEADEFSRP
jgi:flavin reductase (DIM6/NTAB) family NADH-FMN oxidoreductase RutF